MSPEPISKEPARTVDVIRKPNYDLLVNLAASDQSQVQEAVRLVEGTDLRAWPIYSPLRFHKDEQGLLFKVDNSEYPRFLAKRRYSSTPPELSERISFSRQAVKESRDKLRDSEEGGVEEEIDDNRRKLNEDIYQLRKDVAWSSVANEMNAAPVVVGVISSTEAQELAAASDFSSIEFVEPLVGVIDKSDKRGKTIIYRFVEGREVSTKAERDRLLDVSKGLLELLLKAGIVPADLNPHQFLIGKDNELYLLDTELYFKDGQTISG